MASNVNQLPFEVLIWTLRSLDGSMIVLHLSEWTYKAFISGNDFRKCMHLKCSKFKIPFPYPNTRHILQLFTINRILMWIILFVVIDNLLFDVDNVHYNYLKNARPSAPEASSSGILHNNLLIYLLNFFAHDECKSLFSFLNWRSINHNKIH